MTANQLSHQRMIEERRHNSAFERETYRHNYVTEQLSEFANRMKQRELEIQEWYNQRLAKHYATQDANQSYANYTNRMSAVESAKHNRRMEAVNAASVRVEQLKAQEAKRHNQASEDIQSFINASQVMVNDSIINYNKAKTKTEGYQQKALQSETFKDYTFGASQVVNAVLNAFNGSMNSVSSVLKFVK